MLGHHRQASEINGVSQAVRRWPADSVTWIPLLSSTKKGKRKKKCFQSWNPSDKTFWIRACNLYLKINEMSSLICMRHANEARDHLLWQGWFSGTISIQNDHFHQKPLLNHFNITGLKKGQCKQCMSESFKDYKWTQDFEADFP